MDIAPCMSVAQSQAPTSREDTHPASGWGRCQAALISSTFLDMVTHWCPTSTEEAEVHLPQVPGGNHLSEAFQALGPTSLPSVAVWWLP